MSLIIIGILAVAFAFGVAAMLILNVQVPMTSTKTQEPTVNIVLYEGETPNGHYGFGYTPDNLTSPGPTLRFIVGDVVRLTVYNVGKQPHAFAVTSAPMTGSIMLLGAEVGSAGDPLQPGQNGSVVFGPLNPTDAYYISPVAGDAEAGLWGSIIVTGSGSGSGM